MYLCIGKRFNGRTLVSCTNTSETPSINPVTKKTCTVFLCSSCASSSSPKRSLHVDLPDVDKPNQPELEASDFRDDDTDFEIGDDDFIDLEEIEL